MMPELANYPTELRDYVNAVRDLADELRTNLERAVAKGATLAACADQIALEVGRLASPRMLDLAVRILLSQSWRVEELRAWYSASLLALPGTSEGDEALVLTLPGYYTVRRALAERRGPTLEGPR